MNKYEKFPFIEAVNSFSHEITTLINEVPWIPSHGDLHGNNVLVSDDGPYFIDLEHFSYQPFYVDVLTIFMNRQAGKEGMYSAELLKHLLNGQVDDLMDHLVNELNVPYPFSQNRKLYLSAALMSLILTRSRQGGGGFNCNSMAWIHENYHTPLLIPDGSQSLTKGEKL